MKLMVGRNLVFSVALSPSFGRACFLLSGCLAPERRGGGLKDDKKPFTFAS